jgi:hypothetical protein
MSSWLRSDHSGLENCDGGERKSESVITTAKQDESTSIFVSNY